VMEVDMVAFFLDEPFLLEVLSNVAKRECHGLTDDGNAAYKGRVARALVR
jgi:hypothetical protein